MHKFFLYQVNAANAKQLKHSVEIRGEIKMHTSAVFATYYLWFMLEDMAGGLLRKNSG